MSVKYFFIAIALMILQSANISCQEKNKTLGGRVNMKVTANTCFTNSDSSYDRKTVLEKLRGILNETSTHYHNAQYRIKKTLRLADVKDSERPVGFSVFDLTEPSNVGKPLGECIEFKNKHIYHFALIDIPYSFSHIAVLEDGNLKVFKAINCREGDRIQDIISYLNQTLEVNEEKNEILERVRNYRTYGIYSTVDDDALRCQGP